MPTIAQLLMRQGEIEADRADRQGQIWGQTVANLGQIGGQAVQAHQQEKIKAKRAEHFNRIMSEWDGKDPRKLLNGLIGLYGPEDGTKIAGSISSFIKMGQSDRPDFKDFQSTVSGIAALRRKNGDAWLEQNWATIGANPNLRSGAEEWLGVQFPDQYTPEIGGNLDALDAQWNTTAAEQKPVETIGPDGKPVLRVPTPEELQKGVPVYQKPPDAPKPPTVGSFEDYITRYAAEKGRTPAQLSPRDIEDARKRYQQADDRPQDPVVAELAKFRLDEARANAQALGTMSPEWAQVARRATMNLPSTKRGFVQRSIAMAGNDPEQLAGIIRQAAVEGENVDVKNQVMGRMATVASLDDTRAILKEMKAKGIDTNIVRGTMEDFARRLGKSTNPEYVRLGNRLMGTLINYRRAATGVQFSERESADYQRMFPNYRNELPVNEALIDGLMREMRTYDRVYWENKLGKDGARLVGAVKDEPAAGAPAVDGWVDMGNGVRVREKKGR